jgi:hypothetical protein
MGLSERSLYGPQRCFNAYNHWKLGWFQDRVIKMEHVQSPRLIELESFVNYKSQEVSDGEAVSGSAAVLINLRDTYFIQFNQAKDHNMGTGEYPDGVTVVQDLQGTTELVAGLYLSPNQPRLESETFVPEQKLVIEVCDIIADVVVLSIGMESSVCGSYHAGKESRPIRTGTDSFQVSNFGRDSFQAWGHLTEEAVTGDSQSSRTGGDSFQNFALEASLSGSDSPTTVPSAPSSVETTKKKHLYETYNRGVYSSKSHLRLL